VTKSLKVKYKHESSPEKRIKMTDANSTEDTEEILTDKLKAEYKKRVGALTELKDEIKTIQSKVKDDTKEERLTPDELVKYTIDTLDQAGLLNKQVEDTVKEEDVNTSFELSARILKVHKTEGDNNKYSYSIGIDLDTTQTKIVDPQYIYYRSMNLGETKPIEILHDEGDIISLTVTDSRGYKTEAGYHIKVDNPQVNGLSQVRYTTDLRDIKLMNESEYNEVDELDELTETNTDTIPDSTMESFMNVKNKWMPFTLTQHYTGKNYHYDLRFDTGQSCECFRTNDNNKLKFDTSFKLGVDRRQPLKRLNQNSYVKEGPLQGVNIIVSQGEYRIHELDSDTITLQFKAKQREVDKYPMYSMNRDQQKIFKLSVKPPVLMHKLHGYWKIKNLGNGLRIGKVNDETSTQYQKEWLKTVSETCLYTPYQLQLLDDEFNKPNYYVNTIAKKFQLNRKTVYKYCELFGR